MSETRKYRTCTPDQKLEIVVAGPRDRMSAMCAASTASRKRCITGGGTGCSRAARLRAGSCHEWPGPGREEPYAHGPMRLVALSIRQ